MPVIQSSLILLIFLLNAILFEFQATATGQVLYSTRSGKRFEWEDHEHEVEDVDYHGIQSSSTTAIPAFVDINSSGRKSQIFDQILGPPNYDPKVRPQGLNGTGPVVVDANLHIRTIENIDDVKMQYTAQITFRQSWLEPRAKYSHLQSDVDYLQLPHPERIWMPDLFVANEKSGMLHQLIAPNLFTRIYPNGRILQSYRITLLLACPMDLHAYPMDIQTCPIRMASYGWTTKDLVLRWKPTEAIQMNFRDFNMPQFKFLSYQTETCQSLTTSGNFSCVQLLMLFKRSFSFYMIQIYVPCSMLVVVSWVSFWLEPTAVEARVSLGVTTILTVVTQTYGINQTVPPASYVKALDVFTAMAQIFVFGGLLQFALVNYVTRSTKIVNTKLVPVKETKDDEQKRLRAEARRVDKCIQKAKRIDRFSRVAFPVVFILFNVSYWSSYFPFLEVFLPTYISGKA